MTHSINRLLNAICNHKLLKHVQRLISVKLKPKYIRIINIGSEAHPAYQLVLYYAELPCGYFFQSDCYDVPFITRYVTKHSRRYEHFISALGGVYTRNIEHTIIVKSVGEQIDEIQHFSNI